VAEALAGLQASAPHLIRVNDDPRFVVRAERRDDKVAIVSGGGAGHEPLHTGFVGTGMLDAAVPGEVFASPHAGQVRAAIDAVDAGRGVLLVVKNYTGDVLNFSVAAQLAPESRRVEVVIVDDDLATSGRGDGEPGRRGTAAVVVVEKICGAAAEAGASLDQVAKLGHRVVRSSATLGMAFRSCTPPGAAGPSFDLADDEIEFGVGIHGERGIETRPKGTAVEIVANLARPVLEELGLHAGDRVIAIVNGLGAASGLELSLAHHELHRLLAAEGIEIARSLVGSLVTSLDMHGLSITLTRADDELLTLWDAPVRTLALSW